jgi:hypothetical protein
VTVTEGVAARLAELDARSWARLLRELRDQPLAKEHPQVLAALEAPTSALADGPRRAALCATIAADALLCAALREVAALPDPVRDALLSDGDAPPPSEEADPLDDGSASAEGRIQQRARERERELRRGLDQARRQRDGAEARATRAEARIVELEAQVAASAAESDARAVQLRAAAVEAEQAVARAERRSAARIAELESDLAAARSLLEQQRRDVERDRVQQAQLRGELEELQARLATQLAAAPSARATPSGRPLVLPEAVAADTTEAARWLLDAASLLLVDGYNLTLLQRSDQPLELQRRWLIDRLRPLVGRGGCRPVVVFDGDRPSGAMSMVGGIEVRFTGASVTADDEIVFSVAATDEAVVVVTDDRELQERARAEGANVLGTVHLLGAVDA